MLLLKVRVILL